MKICSKCKTNHPLSFFNKEKSRKDGYYPWCKSCLKLHRQSRYVKRPKHVLIHNKICSFCKEDKPRDQFRVNETRNLVPRCFSCEELISAQKEKNLRRCGSCKQWLELDAFFASRRDGHHATCKVCARQKHHRPTAYEKRRDASLRKHFGITLDQYKELLDTQNHTCPVCLKPLDTSKGYSHPVDHAHAGPHAGRIRAILHDYCNRFVVWKHRDGDQLRRAADLIDKPLTDWVVPEEYLKGPKKKRKRRLRKTK